MEVRKVQESAGTFFVSLPKPWTLRNNVTKGSTLLILERADGSLSITPGYRIEKNLETASLEFSPLLEREIISNYMLGFDLITVASKDRLRAEDLERMKAVTRRLIGLEIVEENSRTVKLQCLLEPTAFPPERILRREYLLVASMHRDLILCLSEKDVHLADAIVKRDDEVDRLYFLLVRILRTIIRHPALSEELRFPPIDCLDYRLVASFIEAIADQIVSIAEQVSPRLTSTPEPFLTSLEELLSDTFRLHEEAIHAFLSKEFKQANKVRERRQILSERLQSLEKKIAELPPQEFLYAFTVLSSLARILDYTIDIADMVS
ncbi:MAG: PhoU domain-containing protein [Candidatus Bathyarchaeia archaeon]